MAGAVSGLNTFGTQAGPIPLTQLDSNISALATAVNTLQNFDNFYVDSGTTNTIVVTVNSPQIVTYGAGLLLQVKVANTNTGAVTINVNSLGAVSVLTPSGVSLSAGALVAGGIYQFQYDGTNFQIQSIVGTSSVGFTFVKTKTSVTTRTSNITPTADPDLTYAITATGVYIVELFVLPYGPTSAGLRVGVGFTGTAQIPGSLGYVDGYTSGGYLTGAPVAPNATAPIASISASSNADFVRMQSTLYVTATGTVSLIWSQYSINVSGTSVGIGSSMRLTKVG